MMKRRIVKQIGIMLVVAFFIASFASGSNIEAAGVDASTEATSEVSTEAATESTTETTTAAKKKKDETIAITISAAGDCTLGIDSRYNSAFNDYYDANNAAYFFKKVKPVFEKDDITIVNFEGTLTESTDRQDKTFTFKGPAKYAKILKKGSVEVVTLANNHSYDVGYQGFEK